MFIRLNHSQHGTPVLIDLIVSIEEYKANSDDFEPYIIFHIYHGSESGIQLLQNTFGKLLNDLRPFAHIDSSPTISISGKQNVISAIRIMCMEQTPFFKIETLEEQKLSESLKEFLSVLGAPIMIEEKELHSRRNRFFNHEKPLQSELIQDNDKKNTLS